MYALFVKAYRELEPKLMICEKEDFDNIENALKDYEMEHTLRIRLENANYELVRKNQENEKKLEAIKDLESKLGIDVITLFKALKGIWVKSTNGDVYYVGSPYLCFSENEKRELEFQFRVGDTWYKIKDYGKTWALGKKCFVKDENTINETN